MLIGEILNLCFLAYHVQENAGDLIFRCSRLRGLVDNISPINVNLFKVVFKVEKLNRARLVKATSGRLN